MHVIPTGFAALHDGLHYQLSAEGATCMAIMQNLIVFMQHDCTGWHNADGGITGLIYSTTEVVRSAQIAVASSVVAYVTTLSCPQAGLLQTVMRSLGWPLLGQPARQ